MITHFFIKPGWGGGQKLEYLKTLNLPVLLAKGHCLKLKDEVYIVSSVTVDLETTECVVICLRE